MVKVYGRRARWLLPWLFVVACVVPRPAPRPPAVIKVGSIRVEELRLKSGLRILVQPDSSRPLVATALVIGTGSADDPRGQEGLAHFVEHLTYHARDASGTLRKDALWRLGVSFNAFTSQDETIYSALGSSDAISLRAMLRTELERLATPLAGVPADLVPRERGVIEAEIDEVADAPHGPVYSRLTALAFPVGHPYERPSGGTPESRGRIGLAEAQRFCTTHYVPTNATLVVAGDVTTDGLVAHLHDLMPDSLKASTDQPRPTATTRIASSSYQSPNTGERSAVVLGEIAGHWARAAALAVAVCGLGHARAEHDLAGAAAVRSGDRRQGSPPVPHGRSKPFSEPGPARCALGVSGDDDSLGWAALDQAPGRSA